MQPSVPPSLRFEVTEAAQSLRISRALLYQRIKSGAIKACKDGKRTFITAAELNRYVAACDAPNRQNAA